MKKFFEKLNSIEIRKGSDSAEVAVDSTKLSQPISAFDFNQEAKDEAAAKVPAAQKILLAAAAIFLLAAGFAYSSSSAASSAEAALTSENTQTAIVGSQISNLVGGDRRLPDHVQARVAEIETAVSGSTAANELWEALTETLPQGVEINTVSVSPNTSVPGARDVSITATVSEGTQIIAWQNSLTADERFELSGAGAAMSLPLWSLPLSLLPLSSSQQRCRQSEDNQTTDTPEVQDGI